MIQKLWCWLWGHKTVVKACTGETYPTVDQMTGLPQLGRYYVFERKSFCVRCGKTLHESGERRSDSKDSQNA